MNLDQARFFMVEQQIRPWDVLDQKVLDLFLDIPRHLFVNENLTELAYSDTELPLDPPSNSKMMSPKVEARLLQALDIDEAESVLEIGTGSGFFTALLANLGKHVTTVEIDSAQQATAQTRLSSYSNIMFATGDASHGWSDKQPYDVIVLTGSVPDVPQAFKEQLTLGGRLALICGRSPNMQAKLITRISHDEWEEEVLFETDLPPLQSKQHTSSFKF